MPGHAPPIHALFAQLIPLNALRADSQATLAAQVERRSLAAGAAVFTVGDPLDQAIYLIDGELQLEDARGRPLARLRGGESAAAHRLGHQSPRKVTARCLTPVEVLCVDAALLDVMLTWDQSGTLDGSDTQAGDQCIGRLLQLRLFQQVPPENLPAICGRLQEVDCAAGDVVIRQKDAGDYFYVITDGQFEVSRVPAANPAAAPIQLSRLGPGDCFGEEALIADEPRNATVVALTDGRLMRLAKADFLELLNKPLARRLDYAEARRRVEAGEARWLDVRLASEFASDSLKGALSLPLYLLRARLGRLPVDMPYIAVCDSGRRSAVAVFLMMQRGYAAYVLDGGLPAPDLR